MNSQKHLFSIESGIHYLNCGYKSPLLKSAEEASIQALIRDRNPAFITPDHFFDQVKEIRVLFGKLVNCPSKNVAIIPSTSYGFASVLNNIKPKKNGNAVTLKNEFPSGYFSLERWCELNSNDFIVVENDPNLEQNGENWNQKIINAIDENTSVVLMSTIHWMNGLKFDLEKISQKCKDVGAKLLLDGTQSVGAIPIDISKLHIHALVCASYKWLFGTYSIALAYISDDFEQGIPLEESYMNRTNGRNFANITDYDHEYMPGAGRYNVGQASNFIAMPILEQGLKHILNWKVSEIQNYCKELSEPLLNYLKSNGVALEKEKYFSYHLIGFKLPKQIDAQKLKESFQKNKIFVSFRGESLRVSLNIFNEKTDIEKLIQTLDEAIA